MKILFVVNNFYASGNGLSASARRTVRYLKEAGEEVLLTQRNKFSAGDTIEVMKADGRTLLLTVSAIYREDGSPAESAPHPKEHLRVRLTGECAEEITAGDVLRSAANNES